MYSFEEVSSVTIWSCGVGSVDAKIIPYTPVRSIRSNVGLRCPVGTAGLYTGFGKLSLKKTA